MSTVTLVQAVDKKEKTLLGVNLSQSRRMTTMIRMRTVSQMMMTITIMPSRRKTSWR